MERFNALGRGMQIMLVAGVLLLIDSFLRWQEVEVDLGPLGEASGGVSAWDDIGGILMGVATIALVAWIAARLAGVDVPLPVSSAVIAAGLAAIILVLAVVKNLEDDYSTIWAWIGMALAIAIAVGAWLVVQGAGGVDALKTEVTGMTSSGAAVATAPP
ncbi:MAG TPA: hypothetical protein VNJ53_11600, partial [Gaiellaceae bacterium]|nr:hypothetical protein [Gaiellaceae bacterium]